MFRNSIVKKLFSITIIMYSGIFIGQMVFQSLFFETFYKNYKEKSLSKAVEKTLISIEENNTGHLNEDLAAALKKNNVLVSVINQKMETLYGIDISSHQSTLTLKTANGVIYTVIKDNIDENVELQIGDNLFIEGFDAGENLIYPAFYQINSDFSYLNDSFSVFTSVENDIVPVMISIQGTVKELQPPSDRQINYYKKILQEELFAINIKSMPEPAGFITFEDSERFVIKDRITNIIKIKNIDHRDYTIAAITSLEPMSELITVLNRYSLVLITIGILIIILISYIYSKKITRPLIRMSTIANNIADQDFSSKVEISSGDELGNLGVALNSISENLEKKIISLEEANTQLQKDYEMQAEQKEKEKEMMGNISHELKTPLTIIRGYLQAVQKGIYEDNEIIHDKVLDEVDNMTIMINEILEIFKLDSPKLSLDYSVFNLWDIVLKVYDKLKTKSDERNLSIKYEYKDEAFVEGDNKKIEQVITNLFTNALKYSPEKSTISVNILKDIDTYKFSIENSHIHIQEEELDKIWEPFYRIDKSRNRKLGGSGLGLVVVKTILNLHNSDFGIINTEKGVLCYFNLKAKEDM